MKEGLDLVACKQHILFIEQVVPRADHSMYSFADQFEVR